MSSKVFIVSDTWQYDGGEDILGVYSDEAKADEVLFDTRMRLKENSLNTTHRVLAVIKKEHKVQ